MSLARSDLRCKSAYSQRTNLRKRNTSLGGKASGLISGGVDLSARDIQLFRRVVGRCAAARKCDRRRANPSIVPAADGVAGQTPIIAAGRSVTWSELAGAVLACICWYFLSGYRFRQPHLCCLILRGLAPYRFGLFRSTPAAGSRQIGDPPKDGLVPLAGLDDLGLGSQEKIRIGIERLSIRGTGPLPL